MDKEQELLKEFLGNLNDVQDNQFDFSNTETPVVEETGEVEPEVKEDTVESLPFHKIKQDPRFQRFVEKEISKKMKDVQPVTQEVRETKNSSLVDAFTEIIGNDTPEKVKALQALQESITTLETKAQKAEEAARYAEDLRQAQLEEKKAIEFLEEGMERIEEEFNTDLSSSSLQAKKTRNDFLDFLERISPKDENGDITDYADPIESFRIFQEVTKKTDKSKAKEIASRSMSRPSTDNTNSPVKRVTFDDVREMFGIQN